MRCGLCGIQDVGPVTHAREDDHRVSGMVFVHALFGGCYSILRHPN